MVHVVHLSSSPPILINITSIPFLPFHPFILSKTVQSPYRFLISVPFHPYSVHRSCHTSSATACRVSSFLPSIVCMLPVNSYLEYMHGVCWRVYGWYITELDIHGHTCMAYAGRDCGIHWLGRVYLTGLGECSDKLDSMDGLDSVDGWIIIMVWMMVCFVLRVACYL